MDLPPTIAPVLVVPPEPSVVLVGSGAELDDEVKESVRVLVASVLLPRVTVLTALGVASGSPIP